MNYKYLVCEWRYCSLLGFYRIAVVGIAACTQKSHAEKLVNQMQHALAVVKNRPIYIHTASNENL